MRFQVKITSDEQSLWASLWADVENLLRSVGGEEYSWKLYPWFVFNTETKNLGGNSFKADHIPEYLWDQFVQFVRNGQVLETVRSTELSIGDYCRIVIGGKVLDDIHLVIYMYADGGKKQTRLVQVTGSGRFESTYSDHDFEVVRVKGEFIEKK